MDRVGATVTYELPPIPVYLFRSTMQTTMLSRTSLALSLTLLLLLGEAKASDAPKNSLLTDAITLTQAESNGNVSQSNDVLGHYSLNRDTAKAQPFLSFLIAPPPAGAGGGPALGPNVIADLFYNAFETAIVKGSLQELAQYLKDHKPLQSAFPRASAYVISQSAANLNAVPLQQELRTFAADFKSDLDDLPFDLGPLIDTLDTSSAAHPRVYLYHIAAASGKDIEEKTSIQTIIDDASAAGDGYHGSPTPDFTYRVPEVRSMDIVIQAAAFFTHMFQNDDGKTYLTASNFATAVEAQPLDTVKFVYAYFGLACAKDKQNSGIYGRMSKDDQFDLQKAVDRLRTSGKIADISSFFSAYLAISPLIEDGSKIGTAQAAKDVADCVTALLGSDIVKNELGDSTNFKAFCTDFPQAVLTFGSLADAYTNLKDKQYVVAVQDMATAITPWIPPEPNADDLKSGANGAKEQEESREVLLFFVNNGALVAELATDANDETKLTQALETVVGSYNAPAAKFNYPITFSIDGNLGGLFGKNRLYGDLSSTTSSQNSNSIALTAAVGPSISFRTPVSFGGDWGLGSISVFLPLIDVGALTSWRISGGTGTSTSGSWSNVFAPGGYLYLNFKTPIPSVPVFIGVGGQYGPRLVNVSTATSATVARSSRTAPAVAVGVTLFSFPFVHSSASK
jgi:hypothetical protein